MRYFISAFALSFIILLASCNRLLEPQPVTQLPAMDAFTSPDRILANLRGVYAGVKSGQFLGGRMLVYHDTRGEDLVNITNNGVTALFSFNHGQTAGNAEPLNCWNAGYTAINRCNVFLKGLDDNPNVISAELATQYRAEALFLRALTYYMMVNLYARPFAFNNGSSPGLPLRISAEIAPGGSDLPRSTVAQVYTQILADLNTAEQNLPLTYGTPLLRVTRAHRNAAIALKVRVYLTMQRWGDAITEAQKLVPQTSAPFAATTGVANALVANVATVYQAPYTTVESVFSFPMGDNDVPGVQNSLVSYYVPTGLGGPIGDYAIRNTGVGILADPVWTANDARRTNFIRTTGTGANTIFWCVKFPTNPPAKDFVPIIRYAEVLLNYAEALVRQNNTIDATAINLLNAVRGRSAPTATYTASDFANPAALLTAIMKERRIELLCEGFRGIDETRLLQPLPAKGTLAAVPISAQNYIWPIPQSELDNNRLMTPN
jgi:hypothetical protein